MYSIIALFSLQKKAAAVALVAFMCALATPAAQAQQAATEINPSVTQPLGDAFAEPKTIAPSVARIIFYRQAFGYVGGVSSLLVNKNYHSSLQLGSFSELCLPPGRITLATQMVQIGGALKNHNDSTAALLLNAGQNTYLRLNDQADNRATITIVAPDLALAELKNTRRQVHTISRVPNQVDCLPGATAAAVETKVIKQENITLGADALFAFGKSDIRGISAQGRDSLDKLITHLQNQYASQQGVQIQIIGHADPLGSAAANQRLSDARAQAIRTYMVQGGISPQTITGVGMGAKQPVITTCGKAATPETIECNKPNRRVVVDVQALAR